MAKKKDLKNWLGDSLAQQEERNRQLRENLLNDTSALADEKAQLSDLLSMDDLPEPDDEEPIPDLFAAEREAGAKAQAGWDDFGSDLAARKQSERQMAQDLFGKPQGGRRRR